jgi:hypothetical protein
MLEAPLRSAACTILSFPIQAEEPKSEAPVLWGYSPELVLERLRQITGRREWWRR